MTSLLPHAGQGAGAATAPRVLFVNHSAVMGGGEMSLLDIAHHFRRSALVVLLADGPFRQRLAEAGVRVEVIPLSAAAGQVSRAGGLTQGLHALPAVARAARRVAARARGAGVIYANSQKGMVVAGLAGLLARRPVIWHLRDMMTEEHFSAAHRRLAVVLANRLASRVVANSAATRNALVSAGGRPDRIAVVHNGIAAARFAEPALEAEAGALRAVLGLDGVKLVGVFGRLARWKGQHVLLEALVRLPGTVHALLVGDALFEPDRAYAEELRAAVERLGLGQRVRFLGLRSDVPALMRACDVVAHTSAAPEPFGRVIVEGMLARRPVIATRAGGAPEIVEDGVTGLLVPAGDATALAGAIRRLALDAPQEAAALAGRGLEAARARFSLEAMLAGVEREVAALAGAPRAGAPGDATRPGQRTEAAMNTDGTIAFWDRRHSEAEPDARPLAEVPDWLSRALHAFGPVEGRRVLDLGCGLGEISLALGRRGAEVTAVDTSSVAVEKLGRTAAAERLPVRALARDAMEIDALGPFDLVVGSMILHHLEPFERFCEVLDRALAPGGRAVFYENNGASRLLMWCRANIAGRFGVPKYGDAEESPLAPAEVAALRRRFRVTQDFPENSFFTLASVYLLRRRGYAACKRLDAVMMRHNLMRSFGYRQILLLAKPG